MAAGQRTPARTARVEATVAAHIEAVWQVVSDVTRTGEWSHECDRVCWLDGATMAAPGVRFRGHNTTGPWRWSRTCEFVSVEAPHLLSWRTIPTWRYVDSTDWCISLDRVDAGTKVVQTYNVTRCPDWWAWLVARLVKAHIDRTSGLTDDLRRLGELAAVPSAR